MILDSREEAFRYSLTHLQPVRNDFIFDDGCTSSSFDELGDGTDTPSTKESQR